MMPLQKIPKSQKDKTWRMNMLKHYHNGFTYQDNSEIKRYFEIAAGKMSSDRYDAFANPFGLKGKVNYPIKLKRNDFISNIFLRIKSEFEKRPFEPVVYSKNSNFENEKAEKEKALIFESLQNRYINGLVEAGVLDPNEQKADLSPEIIARQVSSLKDIETIESQNILDYMIDHLNIPRMYSEEFYNFVVSYTTYSYKDVRHDEVIRYVIHPASLQYQGAENLEFIKNADVITVDYKFTYEQILSMFQDELEEEYPGALKDLETLWNSGNVGNMSDTTSEWFSTYHSNRYGITPQVNNDKFIVARHLQWTSYRKVFILGYDEDSKPILVDEDYVDSDNLESTWQEENREGYIINNKYFIGGFPVDFPIYDYNDPFKVHKNYDGVVFMNSKVQQIPFVVLLDQLQEQYDLIKWKINYTIAKNKDKMLIMPIGLLKGLFKADNYYDEIDDDEADDSSYNEMAKKSQLAERKLAEDGSNNPVAQALHFGDTTSTLLVDDSADGFANAIQAIKVVDLSLGNHIQFLMQVADNIKAEALEVVQFNRFVTGDYSSSDAVRNVQQGVKQSTVILELFYRYFEYYEQSDLQGLVDISRYAYKKGRNLYYVRNNTAKEIIRVSDQYADSYKGIFIKNSQQTKEIFDLLRQEATQMLQNGMKHSTFAKTMSKSSNFDKIVQDIENSENEVNSRQQQMNEMQQQHEQMLQDKVDGDKQLDRDLKKYEIDSKMQVEIDKMLAQLQSLDVVDDGSENYTKLIELRNGQMKQLQDSRTKMMELQSNERISKEQADAKRYDADTKLKVAKENKGK